MGKISLAGNLLLKLINEVLNISRIESGTLQPVLEKESQLLAKGDAAKVTTTVDLPDSVQAPVTQGQELGALTVLVDGQEKARLPLVAREEVPRLSLPEVYQGLLRILFCLV